MDVATPVVASIVAKNRPPSLKIANNSPVVVWVAKPVIPSTAEPPNVISMLLSSEPSEGSIVNSSGRYCRLQKCCANECKSFGFVAGEVFVAKNRADAAQGHIE